MHFRSSSVLSLSLISFFFLSVAACSSTNTSTSSDQTGDGSAQLTACRAFERASSARASRCGAPKLFPFDEVRTAHLASACAAALTARGTRTDAAAIAACAARLETTACDAVDLPAECALGSGALVDGTSCVSGTQCVSGTCARKLEESCGHCAASPSIGDPCEEWMVGLDAGCGGAGGGARCAWVFGPGGDVAAKCVDSPRSPRGADAACGGEFGECGPGTYCAHLAQSVAGKCAPALAEGATCSPADGSQPCVEGTSCIEGICRGKGALGAACIGHGMPGFIVDSCEDALVCDPATWVCSKATFGKPGDACDEQALRCDHGFCSHGASGSTCLAFKTVGAPCDASDIRDRCEGLSRCRLGTCRLDDAAACR
jgi:hypothetical protein